MTTSFFSLLLFFQLLSSTQNNHLSAAYHTQKSPVEDVVVMANPDKKGALLIKGLSVQPEDFDLLYALADFYLKTKQFDKANPFVSIMVSS